MDISSEHYRIIKTTDIHLAPPPFYLPKRNVFLCYTESRSFHVCNLEGEVVVTFEDHPMFSKDIYYDDFFAASYITRTRDIIISVCGYEERRNLSLTINISSVITRKCLGKITADASNCSQMRKAALEHLVLGPIGYNERTHEIITADTKGTLYVWSNKLYRDVQSETQYIDMPS